MAVLCYLCAGCATIRRAREAQNAEKVPPGERTVTAAEIGLSSNSVLSLDDALRIALTYHSAIAQASQNLVAATAQIQGTTAAYWPKLTASVGYKRGTANTDVETENNDSFNSFNGALGLNLLLYDFGKTPARVRQAYARAIAAEEILRATRNKVAHDVRVAFFDLGLAQELQRVAEEAVEQFQEHLEQAQVFLEVGRRIKYDVTKAEVDLGNAQLDLIDTRNGVTIARAALNRNLGLAEEPGYRLGQGVMEEIPGDADALMKIARERHPELLALHSQERVAFAAVDEAIADLYPSIMLSGEYGAGGDSFPLVLNWWGAVRSALEFFTGFRKTGKIDETVARLRAARAKVAEREQQIYLDLSRALSQLGTARQRLELTGLIVRLAQESLDLVTERYRSGRSFALEVTDAEVDLIRAQADQVKARFECQTAIAQIKYDIGEE